MAAAPPPPAQAPPPARPHDLFSAFGRFWNRVTEGMAVDQLWSQFRTEARSSYRLYSREVQPYEPRDARGSQAFHHGWHVAKQFFWAVLMKLTPARRVLLLVALAMLLIGPVTFRDDSGHVSGEFDFRLAGGMLVLLVLVLEVADRVTMKRDLEIAREIQSWLTPRVSPSAGGLDIAFVTRPANTVAGDYYDVVPRPGDVDPALLLIVADVAGKSIPAAMLMATLHASLHTLARDARTLDEIVAGLNRYCCEHSNSGSRFTTAFLAEFDPRTRALTSVNAGHNAPVLLRASGAIERLDAGGVPLGISTTLPYGSGQHVLASSDVLFIFTDGLVEAENAAQQEFGEAALLPLLQQYRALPAAEMMARIMRHVEGFVGDTPQHDDITCLVVRVP